MVSGRKESATGVEHWDSTTVDASSESQLRRQLAGIAGDLPSS